MGDMGKRIGEPYRVNLPQPIPEFQPVKPVEVPVERELVPVRKII